MRTALRLVIFASLWQFGIGFIFAAGPTELVHVAHVVSPLMNSDVQHRGSAAWDPASTDTNYNGLEAEARLRTLQDGRATIRFGENSLVHLDQLTLVRIMPPRSFASTCRFTLERGLMYLLHRDAPADLEVETLAVNAAVKGTDFAISVEDDGTTSIAVIDGVIQMSNAVGSVTITNLEKGISRPGQKPTKTSLINAVNSVQWSLYYPGVLDPDELRIEESSSFARSLAAYQAGDLVLAASLSITNTVPANPSERLFKAALLLSAGQVTNSEARLAAEPKNSMTAGLRYVIAAVKNATIAGAETNSSPSQCLGFSYYAQSKHDLEGALGAARTAVSLSPNFGFAWERVAELEFSFGRIAAAEEALDRSLCLAPKNAQAHALRGFLLSADNRIAAAIDEFNAAIDLDGSLANTWLGRGLCRIKRGDRVAGMRDLQTAAVLEPTHSLFRSYLGKAFADSTDTKHALQELNLASQLDDADPTPWLYLALLKQRQNQINPAIEDLQASQSRNTNRSVFRSQLLLDQDRAASSANLASIFRDAGMTDVSVREAARAVQEDYASYSAHLFLAESYDALRDPTRFNLRYETVWFNELLLADLLAPAGVRPLSPNISQQQYSRLLESDRLGLDTTTQYRSDRQIEERASQFGAWGGTSYSMDLDYFHNAGLLHPHRTNNDLSDIEWYTTVKQQVGPRDTLMALVYYVDYHSGDNFQYYNPTNARANFRFDESQNPTVVAGLHHEWSPGIDTLFLGGRLEDEQRFRDTGAGVKGLFVFQDPNGVPYLDTHYPLGIGYKNGLDIYTAELNQIFQRDRLLLLAGGRYQGGSIHAQATVTNPPSLVGPFNLFAAPAESFRSESGFERVSGYGYLSIEALSRVWLTAGLAYDTVRYPLNFRRPPFFSADDRRSLLGPKAALVWNPSPHVTFRGMFAQSLGGVGQDESYRLEPAQLAGFPQAFRTAISESLVGSVDAPNYQIFGAALDLKFSSRTYAGIEFNQINSSIHQSPGYFLLEKGVPPITPTVTRENLDSWDPSISARIDQLLGDNCELGAAYRYDHSKLRDVFLEIPTSIDPLARQTTWADLQQAQIYFLVNHSSGFFSRADVNWYHQQNFGYSPRLPGDDFFQENIYIGCRFAQRRAELMLGALNLSGQNYRLNPLNQYMELPRSHVFVTQLRLSF